MPTHILVECPERIVSAELGVIAPLKPLEEAGKCKILFLRTADIKRKHIVWADILVTVRGCEYPSRKIVEQAKKHGRLIIYYLDDDLLNIPRESLAWEYYNDPLLRENMRCMLEMSHILWGVNPKIREKYLPLTNGAKWLQNRVPLSVASASENGEKGDGVLKILYAGSTDHKVLVKDILAPVVVKVNENYASKVSFTFIGADPELSDCTNVEYIPFIKPYEAYRNFVENGNFAVALAPARTESFYSYKYYNKFIEYTSIGAVGVYTNTEPYTQIIMHGENGFLCDNTTDSWYNTLKEIIDNPQKIIPCKKNAQRLLREEFNPERVAQLLEEDCPQLSSYTATHISAHEVHLYNSFLSFYAARAELLWRMHGVKGIPIIFGKTIKILAMEVGRFLHRVKNLF